MHDPAHSAILITGASSGIGRDAALTLCRRYTVFATVRKQGDADSLAEAADGGNLVPLIADVTKPDQLEAAVKTVEAELERRFLQLVALVNNAGVNPEARLIGTPGEEWPAKADVVRETLECNVVGLLEATRAFLPLLRRADGRIINIGSYFGSFTPLRLKQLGYSASKYAVEALSDGLRRGLAEDGIAVILLKAGNVTTNMNQEHGEDPASIITDAIGRALSSSAPPSRMYVGSVKGTPMWLICRLFAHGPDWLADKLL